MYGMRRIILAVALLTTATAYGINTTVRPLRIVLLAPADRYLDRRDVQAADMIRDHVRDELHALGYDATITHERLDDVSRAEADGTDYYVDIFGPGGGSYQAAAVGVPVGGGVGIDLAVLVGHVAASVNVYDGRTLELVHTLDLHRKTTGVAPAAVGIGGRTLWAVLTVPFVEWAQYRAGIRAVARDAARQIDEALRH
jgi:hypothetical protein